MYNYNYNKSQRQSGWSQRSQVVPQDSLRGIIEIIITIIKRNYNFYYYMTLLQGGD
jgi:hypothetical protein